MRVFPIVLVWCMVVGAAFAVFSTFLSGIGSFYHPNADGAHLRAFYGLFWMILLSALLFLAFLIMSKRDQWAVWVQAAVLVAFAAGAFGVERAYVALNPQPSHFLMSLNGTYYSLPRAYSPRVVADKVEVEQIATSICVVNLSPNTGSACQPNGDRPRTAIISLSNEPIAPDFLIARVLEGTGVSFEGDTIGPMPEGVGQIEDGVLVLEHEGAILMLELDAARQVRRAVWCRDGVLGCHGHSRTAHGHLSFPSVGKAQVDKARWDAEEARVGALFDAWRCAERSCGGVFKDGATEGFE